jgi:hypothetical protein
MLKRINLNLWLKFGEGKKARTVRAQYAAWQAA